MILWFIIKRHDNLCSILSLYIYFLAQKEEAVVSTRQCEQHVDCERECKNVPEEKDADESLGDVDMYNYTFSNFITIL